MEVEQYNLESLDSYTVSGTTASSESITENSSFPLKISSTAWEKFENDKLLNTDSILIKDRGQKITLKVSDILYCKADRNYCWIITEAKNYFLTMSLRALHSKLNTSSIVRVHRSYLVNLDAVEKFQETCIHISDGVIPISRSKRKEIINRLHKLIQNNRLKGKVTIQSDVSRL